MLKKSKLFADESHGGGSTLSRKTSKPAKSFKSLKSNSSKLLKPLKPYFTPKKLLIYLITIILVFLIILFAFYLKAHMKGTVPSACWIKSDLTVGGPSASDLEVDLDPNMIPIKQGASTLEC
ncbi:MAG: hypothetical protein LBL08_02960, partial [Candidatus Nomurabacteria bacterium]|nr:hypothetical protein [Candidatus Nomurabacteria bacterium]